MVTHDSTNCQGPEKLRTSALAESLRLFSKALLIIIAAICRLGAAGLAATAAHIDEKIADPSTVQSGPSKKIVIVDLTDSYAYRDAIKPCPPPPHETPRAYAWPHTAFSRDM